jgi:hypothetical protein
MNNKILVILLCFLTACSGKNDAPYNACTLDQTLQPSNGKPTVLIIGDSISLGYTPFIQQSLDNNYDVIHNPCNAENSTWTLANIDVWLAGRTNFESITWNNGLWDNSDFAYVDDNTYVANLHAIAIKIKAKTNKPLFILTTQVLPNTPDWIGVDTQHKNTLALTVMNQENIPVLDLYTVSTTIPQYHITPTNVHYTDQGYQTFANSILTELNNLYGIN